MGNGTEALNRDTPPWIRADAAVASEDPIPFGAYLERVRVNPWLAESAHARLYRAVWSAGVERRAGMRHYKFFEQDLFGLDQTLERLVEDYLHPAALGLETRRRLVLLVGPVGGGKSTLVTRLKRGLEELTATEAGQVWAIAGCPLQEDPLHLLPDRIRQESLRYLGLRRADEGTLCPVCRQRLEDEWSGRFLDVSVERVRFSEAARVGIGTFVPSDPKSQDLADLVGSLDFSTITTYGSESDPRAYRFDGELYRANRGIMEFQEMLKLDEKFLYHLLGLTQEGCFKAGRFPLIHADEVIIGHTNEPDYRVFQANPRNEALLSRMMVIRVPYPLAIAAETEIYRKVLAASDLHEGLHWAPGALEAAAAVSVASRLGERSLPGISRLGQLAVLNDEPVDRLSPEEREEVRRQASQDGMTGLDPRFVVNRIAGAVARRDHDCLMATDILRALREGAESLQWEGRSRDKLDECITLARQRYEDGLRRTVQRALLSTFEEHARALFDKYLDNIALVVRPYRQDPVTGQWVEPDHELMTSLEDPLGITDGQRQSFREDVWARVEAAGTRRDAWDYRAHSGLRDAVEQKLLYDLRDVVRVAAANRADPAQEARIRAVVDRLLTDGYCPRCARASVLYVAAELAR